MDTLPERVLLASRYTALAKAIFEDGAAALARIDARTAQAEQHRQPERPVKRQKCAVIADIMQNLIAQ